MLHRAGDLLKSDWEKAEVLSAAFASNFTDKACAQASQVLETHSRICGSEAVSTGRKRPLNSPGSVDPDEHESKGVRRAGLCCCKAVLYHL